MNNEQSRRNSGGNSFLVFWLPDSVYNHHQEGNAMTIPKYDKLMKLFLHTLALCGGALRACGTRRP